MDQGPPVSHASPTMHPAPGFRSGTSTPQAPLGLGCHSPPVWTAVLLGNPSTRQGAGRDNGWRQTRHDRAGACNNGCCEKRFDWCVSQCDRDRDTGLYGLDNRSGNRRDHGGAFSRRAICKERRSSGRHRPAAIRCPSRAGAGVVDRDKNLLAEAQMDLDRYKEAWAKNAIPRQTLEDQEKVESSRIRGP